MSFQAINWAYQQSLDAGMKFTLVTLCNYADESGGCFPKHDTLAKQTGHSRATIIRHIKRLAENGMVFVEHTRRDDGRQGANRYRVSLCDPVSQSITSDAPEYHLGGSRVSLEPFPESHGATPITTKINHQLEPSIEPLSVSRKQTTYSPGFDYVWKTIKAERLWHKTPPGNKAEAYREYRAAMAGDLSPIDTLAVWRSYVAQCKQADCNTKHFCRWIKLEGYDDTYEVPLSGKQMADAAMTERWRRQELEQPLAPGIAYIEIETEGTEP
jgi:biotin operon repressor